MNEYIQRIQKKGIVMGQLKKYRPALIVFFQEVVMVSTEVQPLTNTKVINFNNDVIRDLPPRMRSAFMAEFEHWLERNGKDFLDDDVRDGIEISLEVTRTGDSVHIAVIDEATAYTVFETIDYADLAPFLQAGLDYHPHSQTFFIPRS